ncbi:MAG TPA: lysophospholipid acyltransferase family protein [Ignavibacteriales bacterium]|nr:lysophospholipid acyltransferase family protein [Ignavibacteriales bacterium]
MEAATKYKKIFADDIYATNPESKGRIYINSSITFWKRFVGIVFKSASLAQAGKYDGYQWANSSIDILDALENAGMQFEFTGLKNIQTTEGPVVFISNHMSTLETVVLPGIIQPVKPITFVVKKELLSVPKFKHILSARDPIVVGRQNPREDLTTVMEEGSRKIKEGRSIVIFPQSTRNHVFNPESFNSLGVKLAKRNNIKVIPIALVTDAWGNGRYMKEFGKIDIRKKVRIAFGPALNAGATDINVHKYITDFIIQNLKNWGRTDCLPESLQ